ncbi:MAG: IS66 family transposase, partial [Haliea sp.]
LGAAGITVSRATLTQLSQRAIELLEPIHHAQLRHLLQSRVLAMDETPIRAGPSKKSKGKMHQGWYWPVYGQDDEVSFLYSPSRGAEVVKDALGEHFEGVLVTDGYAAYGKYAASRPAVTPANCWAHTRRQFERAKDAEPNAVAEVLEIIGRLYMIEREIKDRQLTGEDKLAVRSNKSASVVDAFWQWCETQRKRMDLIPSNPLSKALKYAFERVEELQVFLGDPDVPIDTNHLERALRVVPMGRKNWLFCWTEVGARHVGVIQSLLTTCRLHGVNPYTYLVDVLQRISQHPASQVEELTPRLWKAKFAANPLLSDLDRVRQ